MFVTHYIRGGEFWCLSLNDLRGWETREDNSEPEERLVSKAVSFNCHLSRLCRPWCCECAWTSPCWDTKLQTLEKQEMEHCKNLFCFVCFFLKMKGTWTPTGMKTMLKETLGISWLDSASTHGLNQSNSLPTAYRYRDQDSLGREDPLLVKSKMLNFSINSNILKSLEGHFYIFYRVFFWALYRENHGKQSIWPQNQNWPKAFLPNSFRPQKLLQPILEMGWIQCMVTRASCTHNLQLIAHILSSTLPTNNRWIQTW